MPLLELDALDCGVVTPVSLAIGRGECVGVSGPSGSGKTRLLRAVADLDPHGGECRLEGAACSGMRAHDWRRQVSLLTADSRWWADTVGEHFPRCVENVLERLGFDDSVLAAEVGRLSTGQRQRLALARLLSRRPRVLLLDEPTANLDEGNRDAVESLVADFRDQDGIGVLWVSHDAAQLQRVADRHFRIRDGRLVAG
ncbi:ATP-binding cassette domain-containing protein [Ectothiorhodospiraceae bacterium WFHF3C12]|nr:ATP-binding cassette domain-containing protein [Ectothiorhodospiraceae bacterium WFHF3C12]